jgi:hypothetical protein
MNNLNVPFGKNWKRLTNQPDLEHYLFFKYLLMSPSYFMAAKIRKKRFHKDVDKLPEDIDVVLSVYDKLGLIHDMPFEEWWKRTGVNYFSSTSKNLSISLDTKLDKEILLKEVEKLIDSIKNNKTDDSSKIIFNKKINIFSLYEKYCVVKEKVSCLNKEMKLTEYWKIALLAGVNSSYLKGLSLTSLPNDENSDQREYLTMLVTRYLRDALFISENAARGVFPSSQKPKHYLSFDNEFVDNSLTMNDWTEIFYYTRIPTTQTTEELQDLFGTLMNWKQCFLYLNPEIIQNRQGEPYGGSLFLKEISKMREKKAFKNRSFNDVYQHPHAYSGIPEEIFEEYRKLNPK